MTKHYEFVETDTVRHGNSCILTRIRATIDLPQHGVKAGDLGGYIENESNLSDTAWVGKNSRICSYSKVYENAHVYGNSIVEEYSHVFGNARIGDGVRVKAGSFVFGTACITGEVQLPIDACIGSNADFVLIGPAISSKRFTTAYRAIDNSILVSTGCFVGSIDEFKYAIKNTHKDSPSCKKQYMAFVNMIYTYFDYGIFKRVYESLTHKLGNSSVI